MPYLNPINKEQYNISLIRPKEDKESVLSKIARYSVEIFKIFPTILGWAKIAHLPVPIALTAASSFLGAVTAGYSLFKNIQRCLDIKKAGELVNPLLDGIRNILFIIISLLSSSALLFGFSVAPWIIALLGTLALLLSIVNFFYKEVALTPSDAQAKIELKVPNNASQREIGAVYTKMTEVLRKAALPLREIKPPIKRPRALSFP